MKKADLHVHSKYSDHPSTWGHKVYNSPESFTEIDTVYQQAKQRGMDFVTLTDHDDIRGSIELVKRFPDDTFISSEITTYFPEDNCKIHILVYGITENQFDEIKNIRNNIYVLRDYIRDNNIAYSVAHATYDQDGKLQFKHIEKLILLFDVFEVINGGSASQNNLLLHRFLQALNANELELLEQKHGISPLSKDPWIKGFTGGSDDHCGILIGSAFTQCDCQSVEEFLNSIRDKRSLGNGMYGSFEAYATGVFKHIHDYRSNRDTKYRKTKMSDFLELFFSGTEGNLMKRFKKSQSLRYLKKKNSKTHNALHLLLKQINEDVGKDISVKIPIAYEQICKLHDEMFSSIIVAMSKKMPSGDIFSGFQNLTTLFPMTLLATPFLGSMRHQMLKSEIKRRLIEGTKQHYTQKALWFTDTIDDLNGVSVTLKQIANQSKAYGYHLNLVTCVNESKISSPLPLETINFQPVKEIRVPGYEQQTVGFPSLLKMMKEITLQQPDQIIISTPGPLGLGALLCAKLMDLPVKCIYHTDFAEQVMKIANEPTLASFTDTLINIFYKQADTVFAPSKAYIDKLAHAGLKQEKLKIFPRGLDCELFYLQSKPDSMIRRKQLHGEFTLMFAGRISKDKNLALLTELAMMAHELHPGLFNFVIAGDGPDLSRLQTDFAAISNTYFTGRISTAELAKWYRSSDLFVFPSHTDTFGMVILEAQACGLPCLVTNTGGPKEIIDPGVTGQVIATDDASTWLANVVSYQALKKTSTSDYDVLKKKCNQHVTVNSSWSAVFDAVLGEQCKLPNSKLKQSPEIIKKQHKAA
ncbi:MAG: glycosyltransferase [Gammaproteobacteria bacterium]|nr:glycosyltransferase [Gammaproteobacteria bacterium]